MHDWFELLYEYTKMICVSVMISLSETPNPTLTGCTTNEYQACFESTYRDAKSRTWQEEPSQKRLRTSDSGPYVCISTTSESSIPESDMLFISQIDTKVPGLYLEKIIKLMANMLLTFPRSYPAQIDSLGSWPSDQQANEDFAARMLGVKIDLDKSTDNHFVFDLYLKSREGIIKMLEPTHQ